ncbi:cobalamin biosynthesis protein [Mycolicibacterium arenosum]|uniref:Cobalamin biosynthesis protein CobD n=1 Tax=Mycolicibacterium arenosum TaxID=2952157 RepID=A0ABT1MBY2_9MYCO|nr:cobalamin biosynthesis protein [Mycolicibacterium sp. CAU 1645]MCP9276380.1 cobalamin biosynthesis protein [Mycolicibacterium sp. CAU 1645]
MSRRTSGGRAAGLALGLLADRLFGDPRRGHPVAGFGQLAATVERRTHADSRLAGVGHTGALLMPLAVLGYGVERAAARRGPAATAVVTALATYVVLGGTSLARTGERMARLLESDDVAGARALLPSLCGRDPAALDASGLIRAALESVAENTSDAQVAPMWWGLVAGVPGLLVYRGANTLDAMVGHRSPRYERFGWAAARFDDVVNYVPARVTGVLVAACAPVVTGEPRAALTAWHRDAARHPSPNAGVAEAAFAGALGVRLGGPTQYAHRTEIRPTLGDGRIPEVADLARSVRLTGAVQAAAGVLAVALSAACRSGRRAAPR